VEESTGCRSPPLSVSDRKFKNLKNTKTITRYATRLGILVTLVKMPKDAIFKVLVSVLVVNCSLGLGLEDYFHNKVICLSVLMAIFWVNPG